MKLKYKKLNKLRYGKTQLRKGDVIEVDSYGGLCPSHFERLDKVVKEKENETNEANEMIEVVKEEDEKPLKKTKRKPKEEVKTNAYE